VETPAMRWVRLKDDKEKKFNFIKKWLEDEKMTSDWNQAPSTVFTGEKTSQE
jgi:hypothetical protein